MDRSRHEGPKWTLQGLPPSSGGTGFWWKYFDFKPWFGRVDINPDGFHWSTRESYDGTVIYEGLTTSLYEAYQSVVQNRPVSREELADA